MPILDVELVLLQGEELPADLALHLAQAAAQALRSEPAQTWVRLRTIPADR